MEAAVADDGPPPSSSAAAADPPVIAAAAAAVAAAVAAKEDGNQRFAAKDYDGALACYSRALALDPEGPQAHVFYSNRASCWAALGQWAQAKEDAQACVALADKAQQPFPKGWLRLAKACLELKQLGAANDALCKGLALDPGSPDLRRLQKALAAARATELAGIKTATDPRLRPTPAELQTLGELGQGNFTRILHVLHRGTKEHFALKVIEKAQLARVRARHPNVANEVNMERRLLSRLRGHPNLVELYHAFQDHDCLYYLLEYCPGGEVWQRLQLRTGSGASVSVGAPLSLARFWAAEVGAALEFLHGKALVHRDVKPENMVLTARGRLKLIDFGSAKDMVETELNGPEFVGTPEYMSPEAIKSRATGPSADLWALGCSLFQFLTGFSPFKGPSPYLVFLRAQRARPHCPDVVPPDARDLILRLIRKRPQDRLGAADHAGYAAETAAVDRPASPHGHPPPPPTPTTTTTTTTDPASRGFAALKAHPFFAGLPFGCPPDQIVAEATPRERSLRELSGQCLEEAMRAEPTPSPSFLEGMAALTTPAERAFVAHPLERQGRLTEPRVLRLALTAGLPPPQGSSARARLLARIDRHGRAAYGLGLADQGKYRGPFFLLHLAGIDSSASSASSSSSVAARLDLLKRAALAVNRLRPRLVVVEVGALVVGVRRGHESDEEGADERDVEERVWEALGKVSESIPVLPVPQGREEGAEGGGGGGFGFWFGGVRGLLTAMGGQVGSSGEGDKEKEEEDWLVEELEQGRYHDRHLLAFAPGPWFPPAAAAPGGAEVIEGGQGGASPRLLRWALGKRQGRATRLRAVLVPAPESGGEAVQVQAGAAGPRGVDGASDASSSPSDDDAEEKAAAAEAEAEDEDEEEEKEAGVRQVWTAGGCVLAVYRDRVVPRFVGLEELAAGAVTVELQPEAPRPEDEEGGGGNYVVG